MAIRVLSGILVTRGHREGNATIHFRDHSVTGTITSAGQKREIGPNRRFIAPPCKVVSLREIKVHETDEAFPTGRSEIDFFRINDTVLDQDKLEIEWEASGRSKIEEISYLIVGEVQD
jgi:hypothetical protein